MAINNIQQKYAPHPGKLLKRELEARGLTQTEFAARIGMTGKNLSEVLNEKARLQPSMAYAMQKAFGMSANTWLNLQQNYDLVMEENRSIGELQQDIQLVGAIDYTALHKRFSSVLPLTKDTYEKVAHMRRFLNVSSLTNLFADSRSAAVLAGSYRLSGLREKTVNKLNYLNLLTWMHAGMVVAEETTVEGFKKSYLKKVFPVLITASRDPNPVYACMEMIKILHSVSVRTVFVPYLTKTYVNGVTQWDKEGNPIITLSNFRGPYWDVLLFSWFHEIGHIYLHGKEYFSLSLTENSQILSLNEEKEAEADNFASECLLSEKKYCEFVAQGDFSLGHILTFSKEAGIHPCVLIGRLAKRKELHWQESIVSQRTRLPEDCGLFSS